MISKLMLAVQECYERARDAGAPLSTLAALAAAYDDVRDGLGFHKPPEVFGAFPTDPYSHTPAHAGAQQPGMTGQVKEDVLARWGELGVEVQGGRLGFAPTLLPREEFLPDAAAEVARAVGGAVSLALEPGTLAFTFCQVPVVYRLVEDGAHGASTQRDGVDVTRSRGVVVTSRDGSARSFDGAFLDAPTSREIFERRGTVARIEVAVPASGLQARDGVRP
jgi:hypothetical protein